MQTEKNQGKTNFRIVGANFSQNLFVAVSLYYSILSTSLGLTFADVVFFYPYKASKSSFYDQWFERFGSFIILGL